jgi:thiazole synthase
MNAGRDFLIIGGGVIGLAIALELKQRGATVTVLSRNFQQAASHAAAGMLAPGAEQLTSQPMQQLCYRSLRQYSPWIRKLEDITGVATGYLPNGILAPVYESPDNPQSTDTAIWLDQNAIHFQQPRLSEAVVGGWWYPEDGQVDNRGLTNALLQAAQTLGVEWLEGVTVHALQQQGGKITGVRTSAGDVEAGHYILATGAWGNQLLPLPVRPVKGQMLSLQMPQSPYPLQRVLYGTDIYIVPRQDGRLVLGATVEEVNWTPGNTPQGINQLLTKAIRLYPDLAHWTITETWWGYRPGTPDELPILGKSSCDNLTLATGHYRNGILLAPVTASLVTDLVLDGKDDPLLAFFSDNRSYQIQDDSEPKSMMTLSTRPVSLSTTDTLPQDDLVIAGRRFQSRLLTGTGKYPSLTQMQDSIEASGCQIVTVAVRRVQTQAEGHEGLAEAIDWKKIWMLPNTAGCKTAEEAIRVARLGREMAKLLGQEDNNFVKLEVIPDPKYLLPDPIGTLEAAEKLVKEGFAVLPYINADPMLAKRLEDAGCATVMPLGSPIGSGQGLQTLANVQIIIEEANIPVVVDAGIGTPSEAAQGMELGADALLINSAIALAKNPPAMAKAMGLGTMAGRLAYLAGRIPVKSYASASSPLTGTISS